MTDDVKALEPCPKAKTTDESGLVDRLRSSAKAFRENTVYDGDGDPLRLIVQADEADAAATRIEALQQEVAALREAIKPFADCCEQIGAGEHGEEWAKFRLLVKHYRAARAALTSNRTTDNAF